MDIKDFQPTGVDGLNNGLTPWVATGKHLCGAATDFTLQCCASSLHDAAASAQPACSNPSQQDQSAQEGSADGQHARSASSNQDVVQQEFNDSRGSLQTGHAIAEAPAPTALQCGQAQADAHIRQDSDGDAREQPATVSSARSDEEECIRQGETAAQAAQEVTPDMSGSSVEGRQEVGVQGLAIATCCHHRCSWQHYVGKPMFRSLGFSPDEFEVISWMTGVACQAAMCVFHEQCSCEMECCADIA